MESHRSGVRFAQVSSLDANLLQLSVKGPIREMARLLRQGANPNVPDRNGRTPISYAAEFRQLEIINLLLHWGAAVDSQDRSGRTPLSWAAESDAPRVVDKLLQRGAELDSRDKQGWTALFWGAVGGSPFVLEILLQGALTRQYGMRKGFQLSLLPNIITLSTMSAYERLCRDWFFHFHGKTPLC